MRLLPSSCALALSLAFSSLAACGSSSDDSSSPGTGTGAAAGSGGAGTGGSAAGRGGASGGTAGTTGGAGAGGSTGGAGKGGNAGTSAGGGGAGASGAAGTSGSGGSTGGSGGAEPAGGTGGAGAAAGMAGAGAGGASGAGGGDAGGTAGASAGAGGGSGASGSAGASGAAGAGGGCGPSDVAVLAVQTLSFGEGNSGQWKAVGFDLDGKVSTAASTDLCLPNSGGMASTAYPDGDGGIDNSFGKNLLPLVLSLDPTWTTDANAAIANGQRTTLFEPSCLPANGDKQVISTKVFDATPLGKPPAWDGTDVWPVAPETLSDPMNPQSSTLLFSNGSLKGATFDAGTNGTVVVTIPMSSSMATTELHLRIHAAHVTLSLSPDHTKVVGGRIGGVLPTEEFIAEIKKLESALGLCGTSLESNLETQIRQASDILSDATQDPQKTCDGISIGLGFTATAAHLGSVGPAEGTAITCP